jgi:hypothetical protein
MLIDTGASKTVFDLSRIKDFLGEEQEAFRKNPQLSAGLGTTTLESHMTILRSFSLGGYRARRFPAILLDLDNINKSYASIGLKPIDGVIGSDLLKLLRAQVNYLSGTLKIYY